MANKVKKNTMVFLIIAFCIIMAVVDILKADYFLKSAIKLVVFLALPLLYALVDRQIRILPIFKPNKKGIRLAFSLCIPLYIIIVGAYFLLKDVFDFSNITGTLTSNIGVEKQNFLWVSLYISFINSLLEEFFFRGFAFMTLKRVSSRRFAYIFSAAVFAIYHVAMMIGWFSMSVFVIVLAGLFAGGLIFNYLNEKGKSIYPSWFLHMFANFAINTIGFILFGII